MGMYFVVRNLLPFAPHAAQRGLPFMSARSQANIYAWYRKCGFFLSETHTHTHTMGPYLFGTMLSAVAAPIVGTSDADPDLDTVSQPRGGTGEPTRKADWGCARPM